MKPLKILFLFVIIIPFVSCGGGGGSSSGSGTIGCGSVPQFSYSPETTSVKNGMQVKERFSWCDADGDIKTLYLKVKFEGVEIVSPSPASNYGITGTSGSREVTETWNSGKAVGTFETSIWVVDAKGNSSNVTTFNMTVTAKDQYETKNIKSAFGTSILNKVMTTVDRF